MGIGQKKLFTINVEHAYFADSPFTGCAVFPAKESRALFHKYDLLLKSHPGGFSILFPGSVDGVNRGRESVLKELQALQFHFQVTDPLFYQYTDNLPDQPDNKIFRFSNVDEKQQTRRKPGLLHDSEFVSGNDVKPSADASGYFGYIEIQPVVDLPEDLCIRFLNRSTYWCYIFVGEYLQKFEKLTILDKSNQQLFTGPEIVELTGGGKGLAFTSAVPMALMKRNNRYLQLVSDYDETTNQFQRLIIAALPCPSLPTNTGMKDGAFISEILIR